MSSKVQHVSGSIPWRLADILRIQTLQCPGYGDVEPHEFDHTGARGPRPARCHDCTYRRRLDQNKANYARRRENPA
jgi:hypothetical protein